jgi:hypothetical protein
MTPPQGSYPPPRKPRAASPAERGAEYAEIQRQLKLDAAARRKAAASDRVAKPEPRRPSRGAS